MSANVQTIIAAAFWIATAMAETSSDQPSVDLEPLPASEIALRFADVRIDTMVADHVEVFHAGGIYELQGRAVTWGNFTVADGLICVKTPPRPQACRRVAIDKAGGVYLSSEGPKSGLPRKIELRALR